MTGSGRHLILGGIPTFACTDEKYNEERHNTQCRVLDSKRSPAKYNSAMLLSKISTVCKEGDQLKSEIRRKVCSKALQFRTKYV